MTDAAAIRIEHMQGLDFGTTEDQTDLPESYASAIDPTIRLPIRKSLWRTCTGMNQGRLMKNGAGRDMWRREDYVVVMFREFEEFRTAIRC